MKLVRVSTWRAAEYYPIADNRGLVFGYLKKAARKELKGKAGGILLERTGGFASAQAVVARHIR